MKWQSTYGPKLLPWNKHLHKYEDCLRDDWNFELLFTMLNPHTIVKILHPNPGLWDYFGLIIILHRSLSIQVK